MERDRSPSEESERWLWVLAGQTLDQESPVLLGMEPDESVRPLDLLLDDTRFESACLAWPLALLRGLSREQRLRWFGPGCLPPLGFVRDARGGLSVNEWEGSVRESLRLMRRCLPRGYTQQVETLTLYLYQPVLTLLAPAMLPALSQLLYAESVLYLEPRDIYYRDHVPHQVRVALLLDALLRAGMDNGEVRTRPRTGPSERTT
jgi:hypothetical protein